MRASFVAASLFSLACAWPDCSPELDGHNPYNGTAASQGVFGPVLTSTGMWCVDSDCHPIVSIVPTGSMQFPLFAFMHGSTGQVSVITLVILSHVLASTFHEIQPRVLGVGSLTKSHQRETKTSSKKHVFV